MSKRQRLITAREIAVKMIRDVADRKGDSEDVEADIIHEEYLGEANMVSNDADNNLNFSEISVNYKNEKIENDDYDPRDRLWKKLSSDELGKMDFLFSTTSSKNAINKYFEVHKLDNEVVMKQLLLDSFGLIRVQACSNCGEDTGSRCLCLNSDASYIHFCDLKRRLNVILRSHLEYVVDVRTKVRLNIPSSSPMAFGSMKSKLMEELRENRFVLHFNASFDGIKIHRNGRQKLWPLSLSLLDLEDEIRASPKTMVLAAIYTGSVDPSAKIHDRLIRWILSEFKEPVLCDGKIVEFKLTCSVYDDQAKRMIYGMKGHSAKGACFYCLNQCTLLKINDTNTLMRKDFCRGTFPAGIVNGLHDGASLYFNTVQPMFNSPMDIFHVFHEGIFEKLNLACFGQRNYQKFESRESRHNFKFQAQLACEVDPTQFSEEDPVYVDALNGNGQIHINSVFEELPPSECTVRSAIQMAANKWASTILLPDQLKYYSTSTKPQSPQISLPAKYINAPAALLAKGLVITGTDAMKKRLNIGLLFKLHLTYLFNNARSVAKSAENFANNKRRREAMESNSNGSTQAGK